MMYGPGAAKEFITRYLEWDLPRRLVRYRNHWNLDDELLPNPAQYISYEPLNVDRWPSIITLITDTTSMTRQDLSDEGDPEYRVTYAARTYVWARGESDGVRGGEEVATRVRDDLTTVVRAALLDHPALNIRDEDCRNAKIEETSIREAYSDLQDLHHSERFMAGSYIGYSISLDEVVTREPIADFEEVVVEGEILTPAYLLDD